MSKALPSGTEDWQIRTAKSLAPLYVHACNSCKWHLRIWKKDEPDVYQEVPFKCCSWRHEGPCRLRKGAQDFQRIREALKRFDYWTHVVLTFEQPEWLEPQELYLKGKDCWSTLRKRLERSDQCHKYVQTWERHQSGFPHVHLAISSERLFEQCVSTPRDNFVRYLQSDVHQCGFGFIGWATRLYDEDGLAGYLCKLARELTGAGPKSQIPVNAPPHFRRIRASQRLLPPVDKNPDITGVLKFAAMEQNFSTS